jgi:hypothetical protein
MLHAAADTQVQQHSRAGLTLPPLLLLQVQAALKDIATSPWKVVKYLFNSKVMSALKVGWGPPDTVQGRSVHFN